MASILDGDSADSDPATRSSKWLLKKELILKSQGPYSQLKQKFILSIGRKVLFLKNNSTAGSGTTCAAAAV